MRILIALVAMLSFSVSAAEARGYHYGGGRHSGSHGGHYSGGFGSSHRGGHYSGPHGGYGRHR
jgi:hypothetical protein